jgi:hypothetical protein
LQQRKIQISGKRVATAWLFEMKAPGPVSPELMMVCFIIADLFTPAWSRMF